MSVSLSHPASKAAVIAAALALVAFVWVRAALTFRDVTPVPPVVHPTAVVWGTRVYTRRPPLESWLHRRGHSYRVWARNHPDAAKLLAG